MLLFVQKVAQMSVKEAWKCPLSLISVVAKANFWHVSHSQKRTQRAHAIQDSDMKFSPNTDTTCMHAYFI